MGFVEQCGYWDSRIFTEVCEGRCGAQDEFRDTCAGEYSPRGCAIRGWERFSGYGLRGKSAVHSSKATVVCCDTRYGVRRLESATVAERRVRMVDVVNSSTHLLNISSFTFENSIYQIVLRPLHKGRAQILLGLD